ncbi:MAG: hypothetical protein WDN23_11830 [Edaphobacter sp.]
MNTALCPPILNAKAIFETCRPHRRVDPDYPPDSLIGAAPYPNNTINTTLNPVAKALLNYLPEPNLLSSPLNYRQLTTQGSHINTLATNYIHSFGALTGIQSAIEQQSFHKPQGPNQSIY